MQKTRKYTMELTQIQANNLQQLLKMTTFAKDVQLEEVAEVKEEIDEREEAIAFLKI